jgi:hypothetical protein
MRKVTSSFSLAAAAVVLLGACGSSSPKAASQTRAPSAVALRTDGIKFATCMRAHGVANFPDPSSVAGGVRIQQSQTAGSGLSLSINGVPVNAPAFEAAQKVCAKYLPAPRAVNATQIRKLSKASLEMASCMRAHGVPNFPDPKVGAGPGGGVAVQLGAGPGAINPNSPTFQAANKICLPIMQKAGGPPGPP